MVQPRACMQYDNQYLTTSAVCLIELDSSLHNECIVIDHLIRFSKVRHNYRI